MKKLVMNLELYDERTKQKALRIVSGLSGVVSIQVELREKNLTVIGDIDPVCAVSKLRKLCRTDIVSVCPAKEEKEEEPKKKDDRNDPTAEIVKAYQAYNPHITHYYV